MSKKRRILLFIGLLLVVLGVTFHFVPVYSSVGNIQDPSVISTDLCGSTAPYADRTPQPVNFRFITGGLPAFLHDKSHLLPLDPATPDYTSCGEPDNLRFYLF